MLLLSLVALATFGADRVSKVLVQQHLPLNEPHPLLGGLVYLTHTQNSGAAFSLGQRFGNLYLVFAIVASVAIVVMYRRVPHSDYVSRVSLGLILGGALGNAFDRLVSTSVTDFIDLRWWPVFNVADSCIVVGALLLVLRLSLSHRAEASSA